ncbi:RNA polymerase subunit sigma [Rhodobacteraceae bacterium WD3A24]|nr:RNA polymerase subunit sigma [Rhodobacteraceae bacterium WD3A24]
MLQSLERLEKPDASARPPTYGVGAGRVRAGHEQETAAITDETPADWVALVARVRDGQDAAAFAALFRHFAPRVKAFLMKGGASAAVAEDCAQDVMATVWRKAHLFDPSRASVATWIFTIARNRRIDVLRRENRPEPEELGWGPEPEPDQEDVFALQQDSAKLGAALAELPDKQRQLVERAYFGELSHTEIAAETGLPLGTIKSRIRLALERLRHSLS